MNNLKKKQKTKQQITKQNESNQTKKKEKLKGEEKNSLVDVKLKASYLSILHVMECVPTARA